MILWLASYPKSGNTWVRTIIGQIISQNFDGKKFLKLPSKLGCIPLKLIF